jgi:hypothetical protein
LPPNDRPIADPRHDQNVLRVLYTLSELSGKPAYRDAADAELKFLLENTTLAEGGLAAWDAGVCWNVITDLPIPADKNQTRRGSRAWMLWDRCFELSPDASRQRLVALQREGARTPPSPQQSGYAIRGFAVAYQHTRDAAFLKAIEEALTRLEAGQGAEASSAAWLSTAIDCAGAAHRVPSDLATRLRAVVARRDSSFLALAHDLGGRGGFALSDKALTPLWEMPQDGGTTALVAMMCVSRYENTGNVRYRALIRAAADAYRRVPPPPDAGVWPMTFGHAISLQLAAWRDTADQGYLDHAIRLADLALDRFWKDSPLPRATTQDPHYDSSTGADTLALALVELHLSILHITAVRAPPNTIDR